MALILTSGTSVDRWCRPLCLSPLRGLSILLCPYSWGSRPRLNICRRFAARAARVMSPRLREVTPRGWRRSGNACRRFVPWGGHLMPVAATTTCCRFAARADHLIRMAAPPPCRLRDPRPAPKARQTFSLGREPQERGRAPSVKPRSGDRHLAWGVSPRDLRLRMEYLVRQPRDLLRSLVRTL
jgi:hypothetical protein